MSWSEHKTFEPCLSDFGWGEVVSAIGRRARVGGLRPKVGVSLLDSAASYVQNWTRFDTRPEDITCATGFVADFTLALRLPDAIHFAFARRLEATLLSTDRGQASAAAALGIAIVDPTTPDQEPR